MRAKTSSFLNPVFAWCTEQTVTRGRFHLRRVCIFRPERTNGTFSGLKRIMVHLRFDGPKTLQRRNNKAPWGRQCSQGISARGTERDQTADLRNAIHNPVVFRCTRTHPFSPPRWAFVNADFKLTHLVAFGY